MVNRGGQSFWVPVQETTAVSNFGHWGKPSRCTVMFTQQRIYATRAGEIIQYNHVIYTAAQSYNWDNVYHYDKEFRMHMSRHHPHRSWAVILQQAWTMFLKDWAVTPGGVPTETSKVMGALHQVMEAGLVPDVNFVLIII